MRYDCHVQVLTSAAQRSAARACAGGPGSPRGTPQLQADLSRRGIRRAVLVQSRDDDAVASGGFLDALRWLGGSACGVAVVTRRTSRDEMAGWAEAGVRAARLVLHDEDDPWDVQEQADRLDARLPARWPIELAAGPAQLAAVAPLLARCPRDFVCTVSPTSHGWSTALLDRLCWWADSGNLFLKLVGTCDGPHAHRLAQHAPDRLLWGSGWPRPHEAPPAALLALVPALDANAQRLYGH